MGTPWFVDLHAVKSYLENAEVTKQVKMVVEELCWEVSQMVEACLPRCSSCGGGSSGGEEDADSLGDWNVVPIVAAWDEV